jgi:hypothetical protein
VHGQRRPHSALRVVAVRRRRAEQRQHAVPRQLRHGAVETADLLGQEPDHLVEEKLRAFGTERLRDRRRVDQIGDQHRDDPPLSRCRHEAIVTNRMPASRLDFGRQLAMIATCGGVCGSSPQPSWGRRPGCFGGRGDRGRRARDTRARRRSAGRGTGVQNRGGRRGRRSAAALLVHADSRRASSS